MPKKRLRLISWNVNGLRACVKKGFLDWMRDAKPDILSVQEIKALEEQIPEQAREVRGYHAAFNPAQKKGYSGVAVYSKPEPTAVTKGWGSAKFDPEGRVLVHEYPWFTLFSVYFPNGKARQERLDFKMDFYKEFHALLRKHRKKQKNLVICGDVNTAHREIDLARPKENKDVSGFLPMERAWIDGLLADGFVDTFREFESGGGHYSYWDQITRARERNVGWRIDYYFITQEMRKHLKHGFILPDVQGSDHCPVGIELEF